MKRRLVPFFFLMAILLASHIQVGMALNKTYEWDHLLYGKPNHYRAYVATSDMWHVDTDVNVTFRLTLTSKGSSLDHTEVVNLRILVQGSHFAMESEDVMETGVLRNVGDSWEKNASFNIPAEYVGRGQMDNVSISFELTYNEIDNIEGYSLQTVYGPTVYEAMYVNLFRPLLSSPELIAVVVAVIAISGISVFILYRRRVSPKSPSAPE